VMSPLTATEALLPTASNNAVPILTRVSHPTVSNIRRSM